MLITVSRQFGAGGSQVARQVAERLGWRLVDNELIEEVAARAGLPREHVAEREERVSTFVERLARTLAAASPDVFPPPDSAGAIVDVAETDLVRITETVVAELAAQGKMVLVGRGAPAVLSREADALHVKLVAPRAFRIQVAAGRLGCAADKAAAVLDQTDRNRARYLREYYRRDWNDPVNYHLTINTGVLGFDGATEVIVARVHAMGWSADRQGA
jgi:cytidylate kinase